MTERTVAVRLVAETRDYMRGMDEASRATRDFDQKLQDQQRAFEQVGAAAAVMGGALIAALGATVKAAIDWETAWAGVQKTVDATPEGFAILEGELRNLAGVLPATHAEIAAVAEAAGQLGVSAEHIPEFTRVMIDMGEATNLSATDAATALARFMNIMGTSQDQVGNLGSAVVELGNNYATTEAEIVEMSLRLAGAGTQIGFTEGEVLGLATALSSVGIEAQAGGSAMSKVMIDIAASVDEGADRLEQFATVSGMSAKEFAEAWRTDPGAALAAFVSGLANAEAQGQSTLGILADLEITELRMRDALLRASSASDIFAASMQHGNEAFADGTALADEAANRYETLAAKIDIARNQLVDMGISLGEKLMPALEAFVEAGGSAAQFIASLPEPIQTAIVAVTALSGAVLLLGGGALLMIPKIAALKVAMSTLGLTAAGTVASVNGAIAALGGPAIIAIGAVTLAVGALVQESERAKTSAAEWTAALHASADAATMFRLAAESWGTDWLPDGKTWDGREFISNLENVSSYLDLMQARAENAFAALNPANIELDNSGFVNSLRQIEDAIVGLGDAAAMQDSFRSLAAGLELSRGEAAQLLEVMPSLREAFIEQALAADETVTAADGSIASHRLLAYALGETGAAAGSLTPEIEAVADATDDATEAAQDLYVANQNLVDGIHAANDAMRGYEQAVDDIAEELREGLNPAIDEVTGDFNLMEQSGRDGSEMLDGLVISANDASAAMLTNGASAQELATYQARARDQIYQAARSMGLSEEAARRYADRLLAIPDDVVTDVQANTAAADAAINAFVRRHDGRTIRINTATGGMAGPLAPGVALARASGGLIPGWSPGVDDRLGYAPRVGLIGLGGGEYIMPPHQTQRWLDVLEQMRAGTFVGFAGGGRVAAPVSMAHAPAPVVNVAGASFEGMTVQVQNPFTGEYLEGRITSIADRRISEASRREAARASGGLKGRYGR